MQVVRHLLTLVAEPAFRNGLVGAHEVDVRPEPLGKVRGLADSLCRRFGAVCAHHDRAEHSSPSASLPGTARIICGGTSSTGADRGAVTMTAMQLPRFWLVMQLVILVCVLASALIAVVKLI